MIDLYKALLNTQAEMPAVKETSRNPHFGNRYADLETVIETVRPVLNKHGLLFVQGGENRGGAPWLITMLIHAESGQSMDFAFPIVSKDPDNPQAMGAAITYAKRYGLLAILGIATEDDDANAASTPPQRSEHTPPAQPSAPRPNGHQQHQRPPSGDTTITEPQLRFIWKIAAEKGIDEAQVHELAAESFGAQSLTDLDRRDASALIDKLKTL